MNVVLSPVSVPELVSLIAAEVVTQMLNRQPATPTPTTAILEPIRLFGDLAAAKYLGCSKMTIQALRRSGSIPFLRTGRKLIYISTELDAALQVKARKFSRKPNQV